METQSKGEKVKGEDHKYGKPRTNIYIFRVTKEENKMNR